MSNKKINNKPKVSDTQQNQKNLPEVPFTRPKDDLDTKYGFGQSPTQKQGKRNKTRKNKKTVPLGGPTKKPVTQESPKPAANTNDLWDHFFSGSQTGKQGSSSKNNDQTKIQNEDFPPLGSVGKKGHSDKAKRDNKTPQTDKKELNDEHTEGNNRLENGQVTQEEPKHEETKHEETKHDKQEEPKHEETKHEETKHEETKHEETKHDETKHDETKHDETKHDEPHKEHQVASKEEVSENIRDQQEEPKLHVEKKTPNDVKPEEPKSNPVPKSEGTEDVLKASAVDTQVQLNSKPQQKTNKESKNESQPKTESVKFSDNFVHYYLVLSQTKYI